MSARRARQECVVDGCTTIEHGPHGYCDKHRTRIRRHGSPEIVKPSGRLSGPEHPAWAGGAVTYSGAHTRVRSMRGKASAHLCACGTRARQWAYDHADPDELHGAEGPYSADPGHYTPMCVSCHKKADLTLLSYKVRP